MVDGGIGHGLGKLFVENSESLSRLTGTVYTFATMIRFVADSRYIDIKKELEDSIRTTHRKFDSRA